MMKTGMRVSKRRRGKRWLAFVCMIFVLTASVLPMAAMADETEKAPGVSVEIPVTVELNNGADNQGKLFTFELTAENNAPLPQDEVTVLEMAVSGQEAFGPMIYTDPGEYSYTIRQTTESQTGFTLDDSIYHVTVYVNWNDSETELLYAVVVNKEGQTEKPAEIRFVNSFQGASDSAAPESGTKDVKQYNDTDTDDTKAADAQTKKGNKPKTGDNMHLAAYFIAIFAAVAVILSVSIRRRGHRE